MLETVYLPDAGDVAQFCSHVECCMQRVGSMERRVVQTQCHTVMSVHVWLVGRPISLSARLAGTTCLSCLPPPSAGGSRYGYHLGPGGQCRNLWAGRKRSQDRPRRAGLSTAAIVGWRGLPPILLLGRTAALHLPLALALPTLIVARSACRHDLFRGRRGGGDQTATGQWPGQACRRWRPGSGVWIASHRGDRAETPKTATLGPGGGCAGGWLRLHTHTRARTRWCNLECWAVRHGVLMQCKVQKRRGIHFLTPRGSGQAWKSRYLQHAKPHVCFPS